MNNEPVVATYVVYDNEGNIIDSKTLKEGESIKHISKQKKKAEKDIKDLQKFSNQMGGFVTMFYFNHQKLFTDGVITNRANIFRLIMLVTFMNYDSVLVNEDGEPLKPTEMMELLKLNKSTWSKFWKEVRDAGIIYKDDKTWKVSTEWFYKGQMQKCECNYIRVYVNTVRKLYYSNESTQKNHLALSYVIELIPHIHFMTNFIVFDVTANDKEIKFMNTYDICEFLELDTSRQNVSKVMKDFKTLRFEYKGKSCYLFNRVLFDTDSKVIERWMINPMFANSMGNVTNINKAINCLFVQE